MNMASFPLQAQRAAGRPSIQTRDINPAEPPQPQKRAGEMAEAMREIFYRDGGITNAAILGEGFTSAEIVEHGDEAMHTLHKLLTTEGRPADRTPEIIEKAILAAAWIMPMTAKADESLAKVLAWRNYCTSIAAHRIDPWISQSERCLVRLKLFLHLLPLAPREVNAVIQAVAVSLKQRVPA